jgi:hypothetical protein
LDFPADALNYELGLRSVTFIRLLLLNFLSILLSFFLVSAQFSRVSSKF